MNFYCGCGILLGRTGIDMTHYAQERRLRFQGCRCTDNFFYTIPGVSSDRKVLAHVYEAGIVHDGDTIYTILPFVIIPTQRISSWIQPLYHIADKFVKELGLDISIPVYNDGVISLHGNQHIIINWVHDSNNSKTISYSDHALPLRIAETDIIRAVNDFHRGISLELSIPDSAIIQEHDPIKKEANPATNAPDRTPETIEQIRGLLDDEHRRRSEAVMPPPLPPAASSGRKADDGHKIDDDYDGPEPATTSPEKQLDPKTMITRPEIVALLNESKHTWNWIAPTLVKMKIEPCFVPKLRNTPDAYRRSEIEKAIAGKRETD